MFSLQVNPAHHKYKPSILSVELVPFFYGRVFPHHYEKLWNQFLNDYNIVSFCYQSWSHAVPFVIEQSCNNKELFPSLENF